MMREKRDEPGYIWLVYRVLLTLETVPVRILLGAYRGEDRVAIAHWFNASPVIHCLVDACPKR